jgi:hypothetical protein
LYNNRGEQVPAYTGYGMANPDEKAPLEDPFEDVKV